jgi:hypothetical protein
MTVTAGGKEVYFLKGVSKEKKRKREEGSGDKMSPSKTCPH